MKRIYTIILLCVLFSVNTFSQTLIAKWTFPSGNTGKPDGGLAVNSNQIVTTFGGTSAVDYTKNGVGTLPASAQASNWVSGSGTKGWTLTFNSSCLFNLTLSSKQQSGGAKPGPRDFKVQYMIGSSGTWIDVPGTALTVLNDSWVSGVLNNVSLPSACSNQSSVSLRWIMTSNVSNNAGTIDATGVSKIDEIYVYGSNPTSTTWTGVTSTDWFDNTNWTNCGPSSSTDVEIAFAANLPVINAAGAACKSLAIDAQASITVSSGRSLTVAGNITNNGNGIIGNGTTIINDNISINGINNIANLTVNTGKTLTLNAMQYVAGTVTCNGTLNTNGNLTIVSSLSQTGLISGQGTGTINGNVTVQRSIPGNSTYSFISSPVNGANSSMLGSPKKLLSFSNPAGWTNISTSNYPLANGRGYAAYYLNSPVIEFTGAANTGNIDASVTQGTYVQNSVSYVNYNLVGNPYPSPIRINDFLTANNANLLNSSICIWDDIHETGKKGDYANYNNISGTFVNGSHPGKFAGVDYISSSQAFFIQTAAGKSSVSFTNAMRSNVNNVFAKSAKNDTIQRFFMNVTNKAGLYNEILIAFKDDATYGIDKYYDSPKMKGNDDIALYSIIDDQPFVIQTLPLITENDSALLGIDVTNGGEYSFNLESLENIDSQIGIYIEDKTENKLVDFRKDSIYTFNIEAKGIYTDRFVLHFDKILSGINKSNPKSSMFRAFANRHDLIVNYSDKGTSKAMLNIYDISGQQLIKPCFIEPGVHKFNLPAAKGIYVVRLNTSAETAVQKIILGE